MTDIATPLLLLLLLLLLRLLPLLLPSSPGARPGDTVRRPSPIVTRGADKRSIARTLARSFARSVLARLPLQLTCLPKPSTSSSSSTSDHHQICILRPPARVAWIFASVPRLYRGTDTEAANGTAAQPGGRAPPPESVSRCSISAAVAQPTAVRRRRRRRGRPLGEVGRSTGRQGRLARRLARSLGHSRD